MHDQSRAREGSAEQPPPTFTRLLAESGPAEPTGVDLLPEGTEAAGGAPAAADRPFVLVNMASTADGRASIGGRSRAIGNRADRALFHRLRGAVDAVLVGAGTVRAERYGRMIPDAASRERRRARGLSEEPLACVVSGRLSLPGDIPLLSEPAARVVLVTASAESLPDCPARIEYVRAGRDGEVDLALALRELRERFSVRTLLCEGGPHLNWGLLRAGLADELRLTLAPKLAGGADGEGLRIIAGLEFAHPLELTLLEVLQSDSYLFLRYRVPASAPESVSRETTLSSSLARSRPSEA